MAGLEVPLVVLWVVLATIFSTIADHVRDWNAMTDKLVYERLAISIGQTGSILPHLHDQSVRVLAQLYPLLIAPWFAHGYVPQDLVNAHAFDAWVMTSACIPAFFLARRVTGSRPAAYLIAFASICIPWMIYTTTLLTEVAAYPAFLWAVLAMQRSLAAPSKRNDVLALLGIALAFFTRTQFALLALVLPVALVAYSVTARVSLARHRVLLAAYGALAAAALVFVATGRSILSLSAYNNQASGRILPRGTAGPITGHLADLAFGVGILPLLVGGGWLLANAIRRTTTQELQAFAGIGAATVVVFVVEITAWDLHVGNFVIDRYLFYLAPLLVLAFVCALRDSRRPRWSLILPTALVAYGFARHLQAEFLWSGQFPLSTDSPIAWLYKPIADLGGGTTGASAILAAATVILAVAFVAADTLLPPATLTAALCVALVLAFPADTGVTFGKLFSRDGHAGRPLTQSEAGILDWLDLAVGTNARVTEVPYSVSTAYLVTQKYWRDLEFWNKSVRYDVHYPTPYIYSDAIAWFPNNPLGFNPETGAASATLTPWVVQSVAETRFRISGVVHVQNPDVMLIRATEPWRTDWLTYGLYDDGWTEPHTVAHLHVFALPGQHHAVTRTLTLQVRAPPLINARAFEIAWRGHVLHGSTGSDDNTTESFQICVPARGFADIRIETPDVSTIPGDERSEATSVLPRKGGILVADIALANEIGGPC